MTKTIDKLKDLKKHLSSEGYVLQRQKSHLVYKHSVRGDVIFAPKSPSDRNSWKNTLKRIELAKMLSN